MDKTAEKNEEFETEKLEIDVMDITDEYLKSKEEELEIKEKELILRKTELDNLEKRIDFKGKRLDILLGKLDNREDEIEEIEEKLRLEEDRLKEKEACLVEECEKRAEIRIEKLNERIREYVGRLRDIDELQLKYDILEKKLEEKEGLVSYLSTEVVELTTKLEQYNKNQQILSNVSIDELNKEIKELRNKNMVLEEKSKSLNAELKENAEVKERFYELESSNAILKTRLDRTRGYIDYLKRIEQSKGVGTDSTSQVLLDIIRSEKNKMKDQVTYKYAGNKKVAKGFGEFCKNANFQYDDQMIRGFLAAIKSSQFTILKGYSGTGKSALPQLFAMYLGAECQVIPVQPNWRTKQDLMGFYNYFTNMYMPTEFTKALIRARVNSDKIFFIVLDEMNLARVEYYFSEFNSKLELERDERIIELYEGASKEEDKEIVDYIKDNCIEIPPNVVFIGTINEDDSVSPISDKIFDRAQVLEFMQRPSIDVVGSLDKAKDLAVNMKVTTFSSFIEDMNKDFNENLSIVEEVNKYIEEEFNKVIGYRSIKQIKKFINIYVNSGGDEASALDMQLVSKFIPKFKFAYSEEHKSSLEILREIVKEEFSNKCKLDKEKIEELNFVKQLDRIIKEFSS